MQKVMRPIHSAILGLSLVLLSGCMEFEDQEIRWRYLPENDVLVATLRYQGIYGGKEDKKRPPESISKKQAQQLASVMEVERAFFFNNWISEFNRAAFEQKLSESDQVDPSIQSELFKLLLQEIKVVNVGFYLDKQGRLCGAQTLRIGNVSQISGLTNELISEFALKHIGSQLDARSGNKGNAHSTEKPSGTLDLNRLFQRLQKVEYEQMRLAGMVRIRGKYRINLVDNQDEVSFWLEEGSSFRGFSILEVDMDRGFARIQKNGQTAKVYLRSMKVVAEEETGHSLASLNMLAHQVKSKIPFLTTDSEGFAFQMPIRPNDLKKLEEKNVFPEGISIIKGKDTVSWRMNQSSKSGGLLKKRCFPGYVPNALDHVRKEYGIRKQSNVDAELSRFLQTAH